MQDVKTPQPQRRWLWFAGIYLASVITLAIVAYGLRALIKVFM